jgi:multidrug efflux pump subunit AcrB
MNLTKLTLKWNRVAIAFLLVALMGGISVYKKIPQAEDPGFIVRIALIQTVFPGASPKRVEQLVTDKLEKVIQEIPELNYIESESRNGLSVIYVHIKPKYKNMRPIWDALRRKVDKVRNQLPKSCIGPFVNDEFGDVFGQVIALTGDGFSYRELKKIADQVRDELLRLKGVAKVTIHGAQEERVFLEFDTDKLAKMNITMPYLKQILSTRNVIFPGGSVFVGSERIFLEPSGNYETEKDILNTIVPLPNKKSVIYLKDLVTVKRGYVTPPKAQVHFNGQKALAIAISMSDDGNIVELGEKVDNLMKKLENYYPAGIHFEKVAMQPARVRKKVKDFEINLLQSVVIVILVMLFALGKRTGFLVASLIPMTIVIAVLFMHLFSIGIDQISLAALLIALGMLVDNAIVVSENIMVQIQEGVSPYDAAINSGKELAKPLLTSSLITSSAFLPIALAKSSVGEYCASLAKVVSITLLTSWILAITIIPLFCYLAYKNYIPSKEDKTNYNSKIYVAYKKLLSFALQNRMLFLGIMLVIFLISNYLSRFIPKTFFPSSDNAIITVEIETPFGSSFNFTRKTVLKFENYMKENLTVNDKRKEGIVNWVAFIGEGAPRYILPYGPEPPRPNYSYLIINLSSYEVLSNVLEKIQTFANESLPEARALIRQLPVGPPVDYPIEVRVMGKSEKQLYVLSEKIKSELRKIKGVINIKDDWGERIKKIQIVVNQDKALVSGVTSMDVALSLQTMLDGISLNGFKEDDKIIPIVLKGKENGEKSVDYLKNIPIISSVNGKSVPLSQIAEIKLVFEPSQILRRDRYKTITVQAQLEKGVYAESVNQIIEPWLKQESKNWDLGYRWEIGGEREEAGKGNKSIMEQLPVAALLIILLLIIQFNSFRKPLVLLSVIPFAFIGVNTGLLLAHSYFGFMTLLGVVSLCGIVINNANVLMDRIRIELEENKKTPQNAIFEAAVKRLRPIMLTTLTTVGGLIPLLIGGGPMWEPMAIAIIFGLSFATLLTLVVVPVIYSLFYNVKFK